MPEGVPNVEAREDIKITDIAPIVRSSEGSKLGELVNRRWSWPGPTGKPVYNFRSERRDFSSHRCLVLCDGFYEFTDPTDKTQKRLDKWRSEEHTSELQSLMRISYAVFCLKKTNIPSN